MSVFHPSQLASRSIAPGVSIQTMWGSRIMVSLVELAPGSSVPAHAHPHEQMGMVLEGEMTLVILGERHGLRAGDVYLVPSNQEHSVAAVPNATRVLDIFSPPREEYM